MIFLALLAFVQTSLAAEHVILIGDSHSVQTFGKTLDELLRGRVGKNNVSTFASCGSSPSWWFDGRETPCGYFERTPEHGVRHAKKHLTPRLGQLLTSKEPATVIVALGANLVRAPHDYSARTSRTMALLIQNAKSQGKPVRCIWVGPPHGRNKPEPGFSEFYKVLKAAVTPPCEFVDSRPYARYPAQGGDGIHYDQLGPEGVAIAKKWATAVFDEIKLEAAGRIGSSQ